MKNMIKVELRGFLPEKGHQLNALFEKLRAYFGQSYDTEELVIFFKYKKDVRVRITKKDLEFLLKTKPDSKNSNMQNETVAKIPVSQSESFIRMLDIVGYKEGLFSYCNKFYYKKDKIGFCLKLNSVLGDFFEVSKRINSTKDYKKTTDSLTLILKKLGLKAWSDDYYQGSHFFIQMIF